MSSFNFAAASYSNSAPLVDYLSTASPSAKIKYGYPSSHLRELILGKLLIIEKTLKIVSVKIMLHHSRIEAIDIDTRVI